MKITKTEAKKLIDTAKRSYSNRYGYEDLGENGYNAMLVLDEAIQCGVTADEFKRDDILQKHANNLKTAI